MAEVSEEPLVARLLKVRKALRRIPKRGWNAHHKYHYVLAADVVTEARRKLDRERILVIPQRDGEATHEGTLTTVPMTFRYVCGLTGEAVEQPWVGVGFDKGGDKGVYKAFTGATKYALMAMFLIDTGDDPEGDQQSDDGARDAAPPRIPQDRARRIATRAGEVNLARATDDGGFELTAPLKAKLAEVGARKIGALNVDQAEEIEQFLEEESPSE